MRTLLVEDDPLLGPALKRGLEQDGFTVDLAVDGHAADTAAVSHNYAVVVLDLGLPGIEGETLMRAWRSRGDATPVVILTARGFVTDRVRLLDLGADDYLVKPFDLTELCARMRALVRRSAGLTGDLLEHGPVQMRRARRAVTCNGLPVELTNREFSILESLLRQRGGVLSRRQIEQSLHGWKEELDSNAVEVHIHHLRHKLGRDFIVTVRGMGYRLCDEKRK